MRKSYEKNFKKIFLQTCKKSVNTTCRVRISNTQQPMFLNFAGLDLASYHSVIIDIARYKTFLYKMQKDMINFENTKD